MVELSIILPAYLEEENLRILLPRIQSALNNMNIEYELLVIDTVDKLDYTMEVCEQYGVTYINREGETNSYGDAIRTGIKYTNGKYTLFMDADGSHTPEFIQKLYQHIDNNDVVVASRYVKGGYTDNSKLLIFMSKILNKTYSLILQIKCDDISNSFKIYSSEQLKSLSLNSSNFDIVEEILLKLIRKHNIKIKEIPYSFKKRMFGETKRNLFLFLFTFLVTLVKLKFGK